MNNKKVQVTEEEKDSNMRQEQPPFAQVDNTQQQESENNHSPGF